jgi:hypothetical protein
MDGRCTLTQPADEIGRVFPVSAKTQSCANECLETLEVEAAAAVVESCDAVRPQGPAAACVGKGSATAEQKAKCAAAAINPELWCAGEPTVAETDAEKNICWDASKDAADTYSHCTYLEQLSCGLNRVTPDGVLTGAALTAARDEGSTCDAGFAFEGVSGECRHVLPSPAVAPVAAACEHRGVIEGVLTAGVCKSEQDLRNHGFGCDASAKISGATDESPCKHSLALSSYLWRNGYMEAGDTCTQLMTGGTCTASTCAPGTSPCSFSTMLTPVIEIAEILPRDPVSAVCHSGGDASPLPACKVATTCTDVVPAAPAFCAKPAPEDEGSYCAPRG